MLGPYDSNPFPSHAAHCVPLGSIPKRGTDKRRTIKDYSYSAAHEVSVNEYIAEDCVHLKYQSVSDLMRRTAPMGPDVHCGVVDISAAFRSLPLHPNTFHRHLVKWRGKYYIDCYASFGTRSAPGAWELFAWALEEIAFRHFDVRDITRYLDDAALYGRSLFDAGMQHIRYRACLAWLGLYASARKITLPAPQSEFLGFDFDFRTRTLTLTSDKWRRYAGDVRKFKEAPTIPKKELRGLLGRLQHTTNVFREAKLFNQRLWHAYHKAGPQRHGNYPVRITGEARRDLVWWHRFFTENQGRKFRWPGDPLPTTGPLVVVHTDASEYGLGGHCGDRWFFVPTPDHWAAHSTVAELAAQVLALRLFGPAARDGTMVQVTDSQASAALHRRRHSSDPAIAALLRTHYQLRLRMRVRVEPDWVPRAELAVADACSRGALAVHPYVQAGVLQCDPIAVPPSFLQG